MTLWLELLLLAIASMFWPTLILIVVLALHSAQPVRILAGFLAGGLLTTIVCGSVLVLALEGSSIASLSSSHSAGGVLNIIVGLLSLLAAYVIHRGGTQPGDVEPPVPKPAKKPSMAQRVVKSGGLTAFGVGIVLNVVPGTFPIIALKDIAVADASHAEKLVAIIAFYVIMFALVEVPLVAFLFAPERTTTVANEMNAWLGRNGRRIAVYAVAGVGVYLIARGVVVFLH